MRFKNFLASEVGGSDTLDELSRKTLGAYITKATDSLHRNASLGGYHHGRNKTQKDRSIVSAKSKIVDKRNKGIKTAAKKLSEDTLDELSMKTLHHYMVKAGEDPRNKNRSWGMNRARKKIFDRMNPHQKNWAQYNPRLGEENVQEGRRAMPLRGHDYHFKSDDELRYIIKDAGEAGRARRSIHGDEGKYADQVNDAHTVLGYRSRGGKQVIRKPVKEETITELSRSFLKKYMRKAADEIYDNSTSDKVVDKREKGFNLANGKIGLNRKSPKVHATEGKLVTFKRGDPDEDDIKAWKIGQELRQGDQGKPVLKPSRAQTRLKLKPKPYRYANYSVKEETLDEGETVYKERANGQWEYWTYSEGRRIRISQSTYERMIRQGARSVKVEETLDEAYEKRMYGRGHVHHIVNKFHVTVPDDEVAADIERRTKNWPPSQQKMAISDALAQHKKNQKLHRKVIAGNLSRGNPHKGIGTVFPKKKVVGESVITELSKKTLQNYLDKNWFQDAGSGKKLDTKKDVVRYFNRKHFAKKASKKILAS